MLFCKAEFLTVAAADAELVDAPVPHQLMAPAHHARMAQPRPQVIVAQVRVRVKMDDVQGGKMPHRRPHAAQGDKVLAADEQRQLAGPEDLPGAGLYRLQGHLGAAEAQLQVAGVKNGGIRQVPVLVRAVGFKAKAFMPDGGGPEAGARAEAGGRVKGGAEKDDGSFFKLRIAADERFNIPFHQSVSTSRSRFSRKAGR